MVLGSQQPQFFGLALDRGNFGISSGGMSSNGAISFSFSADSRPARVGLRNQSELAPRRSTISMLGKRSLRLAGSGASNSPAPRTAITFEPLGPATQSSPPNRPSASGVATTSRKRDESTAGLMFSS